MTTLLDRHHMLANCCRQADKAAQRAKRFAAANAGGAPAKSPAGNGAASTADDLQAKLKVGTVVAHGLRGDAVLMLVACLNIQKLYAWA
jgi:hypothetical protein